MKKPILFVAMPFKEELDNVLFVIKKIGSQNNFHIHRADDGQTSQVILDEIIDGIIKSDVVIADITYSNPNVFLEIGYAWAIGKEVLLISSDLENAPFDVRNHRIIDYHDPNNVARVETALCHKIKTTVQVANEKANLTKPLLEILNKINDHKKSNYLYNKIIESYISKVTDDIDLWLNGALETDKYELINTGMTILKNIEKGGFITYLAPIDEYWSENDDYFNECRLVAADPDRKLLLKRVYILDSLKSVLSDNLQKNIRKDEESNIATFIVFKKDIHNDAIRDFGIWDDDVVCMMDTRYTNDSGYEVSGATFSKNRKDISRYTSYKNEIMKHAINGSILISELDELSSEEKLLFESIFHMDDISKLYCEGSYLLKSSCNWYHGSWQYLRLVGLVSTPKWHERFYQDSLNRSLSNEKNASILISGTADYGILEQIYKSEHIKNVSDVTVMDICESPLYICKWYHDKYAMNIPFINFNIIKRDIMNNMIAENSQTVIIADAFLTRFDNISREIIIAQWLRMLKPNGFVITTIRIEKTKSGMIKASTRDVDKFVKKTEDIVNTKGILFSYLSDTITEKAKKYAKKIVSNPINNLDDIYKLFKGFDVNFVTAEVEGEINNETIYARVIAKKIN